MEKEKRIVVALAVLLALTCLVLPAVGMSTFKVIIPAGPIWNNDDAKIKCPIVCASYGGSRNGQWRTVVEGKMSVCGCTFKF